MYKTALVLFLVIISFLSLSLANASQKSPVFLCCSADNDLYKVLKQNGIAVERFENSQEAVSKVSKGGGVMILADGYPAKVTEIEPSVFVLAKKKKIRLYVEYPSYVPGLEIGKVFQDRFGRGVVTSKMFGSALEPMRIMSINGCRVLTVENVDSPHIVFAKVAGFDRAVFGLKDTATHPVLFEQPDDEILISTTKLSNFVKGRYGPKNAWQKVWKSVLAWVSNDEIGILDWNETVVPSYGRDERLSDDAMRMAAVRGVEWFYKGNFLIHPSWKQVASEHEGGGINPWGPSMDLSLPDGDGRLGILEGHASRVGWDGSQEYRYWIRCDCQAESSFAFGMHSVLEDDDKSRKVAANLMDYIYFISDMRKGERNDPESPSYGLLGWANTHPFIYYGDDNARSLLGGIGTAALLNEERWDKYMLEAILANFRTTGRNGFRTGCLVDADIQKKGWQKFWNGTVVNPHPHFESWIWSTYLWLFDKTGYAPLLERTRKSIEITMEAYPDHWRWTNGLQQERARMVLPLAWLVRVDDTPGHRKWLRQIVDDVLKNQESCGAIREELGKADAGLFGACGSNASYGTNEAPIIQENGDMAADMLYTSNFFFFGLHEAAYATGDDYYEKASDKLADFLVRIQVKSDAHPDMDGAWFRGFDFGEWQYWGSNADHGWGVWGSLTGWTQSWIVSTLAMRHEETSLWDITKDSKIGEHFEECRQKMMPDDQLVLTSSYTVMHDAIGKKVTATHGPAFNYYGESGIRSLTDGHTNLESELSYRSAEWLGFHGVDLEAVIDMGEVSKISRLSVSLLQDIPLGIHLPKRVEFMVSDNGEDYRSVGIIDIEGASRNASVLRREVSVDGLDENVRYIKVTAKNIGTIPAGFLGGGLPAWLFVEEILVNHAKQQRVSIVPYPSKAEFVKGEFSLNRGTKILVDKENVSTGGYLCDFRLKSAGFC